MQFRQYNFEKYHIFYLFKIAITPLNQTFHQYVQSNMPLATSTSIRIGGVESPERRGGGNHTFPWMAVTNTEYLILFS